MASPQPRRPKNRPEKTKFFSILEVFLKVEVQKSSIYAGLTRLIKLDKKKRSFNISKTQLLVCSGRFRYPYLKIAMCKFFKEAFFWPTLVIFDQVSWSNFPPKHFQNYFFLIYFIEPPNKHKNPTFELKLLKKSPKS
jgi:hypothetical protein